MSCFFVQLYNTEIWTLCLALQTLMSKVPVYLESNTEPEPQVLFLFFLGGGGAGTSTKGSKSLEKLVQWKCGFGKLDAISVFSLIMITCLFLFLFKIFTLCCRYDREGDEEAV